MWYVVGCRSSQAATGVGFGVFVIGWIFQITVLFGFPYNARYSRTLQIAWSLLPWNLLSKVLYCTMANHL